MYTFIIIVLIVILIVLIAMSMVEFKSFKGVKDALEANRKQVEQLLATQENLAADLSKLSESFFVIQAELNKVLEQYGDIVKALNELNTTPSINPPITESNYEELDVQENNFLPQNDIVNQQAVFFAKAYDESDRQIVEAKKTPNASSSMPFKVTTVGNTGTIAFNTTCYAEIAKNAQVLVFPFCHVNMKVGGNPQGIENIDEGEVEYRNGEWIITKKPTIKII